MSNLKEMRRYTCVFVYKQHVHVHVAHVRLYREPTRKKYTLVKCAHMARTSSLTRSLYTSSGTRPWSLSLFSRLSRRSCSAHASQYHSPSGSQARPVADNGCSASQASQRRITSSDASSCSGSLSSSSLSSLSSGNRWPPVITVALPCATRHSANSLQILAFSCTPPAPT